MFFFCDEYMDIMLNSGQDLFQKKKKNGECDKETPLHVMVK